MTTGGPPPSKTSASTSRFGMRLFLASLSVLFLASIVGYLVIRLRAPEWPPPGTPSPPLGLVWATLVLLVSSATMHTALKGARSGSDGAVRAGLVLTLLLGVLFLVLQVHNWSVLKAANVTAQRDLYGFTFFLLTVLHAVHVLGGLAGLGITTAKAFRGSYTTENHTGVQLASMYWHFLDVVWVVLFVVLYLGNRA